LAVVGLAQNLGTLDPSEDIFNREDFGHTVRCERKKVGFAAFHYCAIMLSLSDTEGWGEI
jgi:hypothetical protein